MKLKRNYLKLFSLAVLIILPRIYFLQGLIQRKFSLRKISKSTLILISLFILSISLSMDWRIIAPWLLILLSNELIINYSPKKIRINTKILNIFYIVLILVSIYGRTEHLILGIDKNIFTIPLIPLIFFHKRNGFSFLTIFVLILLSYFIQSTNFTLVVSLSIIHFIFIKKIKRNESLSELGTLHLYFIFILSNIVAIGYAVYGALNFDFNNPSLIFPSSIIHRGLLILETFDIILSHKLAVFSGFYDTYLNLTETQVHNDAIKTYIQHGLILWIIQNHLALKFLNKFGYKTVDIFLIYLYNGILGLMGWGYGTFFTICTLLIEKSFNERK